jgi:hypothetical protein
MSSESCPTATENELYSLYFVGAGASIAVYCALISTFTCLVTRMTRDYLIVTSSWFLIGYEIIFIILNVEAINLTVSIDFIVSVFLVISILFSGLASIPRYINELNGKIRQNASVVAHSILFIILLFDLPLDFLTTIYEKFGLEEAFEITCIFASSYHIVWSIFYWISWIKTTPPQNPTKTYFAHRRKYLLSSILIATVWIAFLIGYSINTKKGFDNLMLGTAQGIALLFESMVSSNNLSNDREYYIDKGSQKYFAPASRSNSIWRPSPSNRSVAAS